MSDDELMQKMRNRAAQCRRLTGYVTAETTRRVLAQVADEAETVLHKFQAERAGRDNDGRGPDYDRVARSARLSEPANFDLV